MTFNCSTITVQRPRVRDTEARFVSQVLPLFKRKSTTIEACVPELYLHGLALGDFELALRGLLGDGAPLSGSTVARLKEKCVVLPSNQATWIDLRGALHGRQVQTGSPPNSIYTPIDKTSHLPSMSHYGRRQRT